MGKGYLHRRISLAMIKSQSGSEIGNSSPHVSVIIDENVRKAKIIKLILGTLPI